MKPPLFQPIDWQTIRSALWQWFTEVSGCETVWANQGSPQPAYPYATISMIPGVQEQGALDEYQIQDDGTLRIVGQRDFNLSCQIHVGPCTAKNGDCNALTRIHSVLASLAIPTYQQRLAEAGLALRSRGVPQTLDVLVGVDWINRVQVDILFGVVSIIDVDNYPEIADLGYFDKVEVSSDLSPLQGSGSLNLDEEILDPNA